MTAEDLTSQTFIAFMEKSRSTVIDENKKYLYGIMRTVWIEFLKKKYQESIQYLEDIEQFGEYSERIIEEYENKPDIKQRLSVYIDRLPNKQKTVLSMRLIDDMSVRDVANELGKDKNYVKTTYGRALKRLRDIMKQPYMEEML